MAIPKRLQIVLSDRHRDLLEQSMILLGISKTEAINRAIEGLNKIAGMQVKQEKRKAPAE